MAKTNDAVPHLIEAATADTMYRDVCLRRARDLLRPTLDDPGYRAIRSIQKELDELVRHTDPLCPWPASGGRSEP